MNRLPSIHWRVPGAFPALAPREVQVWCGWIDAPEADDPASVAVLSDKERTRAAAFHFAVDRRRYTASHVMLRQLLGRYLDEDPRSLGFTKGPSGKPALSEGNLQFNLSHSGPLALLAVTRDQAVGIDLELRWEMPDLAVLEERVFTPAALRRQQRLAPGQRLCGFYRRWTELEAIGKCRGTGLDLEKMTPGSEHLTPADPAEGFTGCLACERPPSRVEFLRFAPGVSTAPAETTASAQPILPGLPHRLEGLASLSSS
jgi:4'-phosphopantetheinyl transferase